MTDIVARPSEIVGGTFVRELPRRYIDTLSNGTEYAEKVGATVAVDQITIANVGVADGADVTQGAKADVAATADTGTFSVVAILKRMVAKLTSLVTNTTGLAQESGGHLAAIDTTLAPATITGTLHADSNTVVLALAGRASAVFQILAASTPLTNAVSLEVDASFDGGVSWNEQPFFDIANNGDWLTGQIVGDQTFVGAYYPIALDAAATHVRVLQVGAGDFGAQIRLNATAISSAPGRSDGQNFNTKPNWTTQVGGRNGSEKLRPLLIGPTDGLVIEGVAGMVPLHVTSLGTPTNVAAVAITASTPHDTYTPAGGKKFRLLGYFLSVSAGAAVIFKYGAGHTEFLRTGAMGAGIGVADNIGLGLAPGAADDHLFLDVTVSGTVNGYVLLGVDE